MSTYTPSYHLSCRFGSNSLCTSDTLTDVANAFVGQNLRVCSEYRLNARFAKSEVGTGLPHGEMASILSVMGPEFRGSIAFLFDRNVFRFLVKSMSYGMIEPDIQSEMAQSAIAELSNIVSGAAVSYLSVERNRPGHDITPPQIVIGQKISTPISGNPNAKTLFLPFDVEHEGKTGRMYITLTFLFRG